MKQVNGPTFHAFKRSICVMFTIERKSRVCHFMRINVICAGNYSTFFRGSHRPECFYAWEMSIRPLSSVLCSRLSVNIAMTCESVGNNTIAVGSLAESLRRSPFPVERLAPSGLWKCELKCIISYPIVFYHIHILFAVHLYCTAFPCIALHCMINYSII